MAITKIKPEKQTKQKEVTENSVESQEIEEFVSNVSEEVTENTDEVQESVVKVTEEVTENPMIMTTFATGLVSKGFTTKDVAIRVGQKFRLPWEDVKELFVDAMSSEVMLQRLSQYEFKHQ